MSRIVKYPSPNMESWIDFGKDSGDRMLMANSDVAELCRKHVGYAMARGLMV